MKNNIVAHAALGKVFNLPTILTTSAETGEHSSTELLAFYRLTCPRSQRTAPSGDHPAAPECAVH